MTEPVKIGDAELYCGDCKDVLPTLGKVDCVVTDPPYLNLKGGFEHPNLGGVAKSINHTKTVGDLWNANLEWLEPCYNLCRYGFMVFTSKHGLKDILNLIPCDLYCLFTWYKRNSPPVGKNLIRHDCEYILAFKKEVGLKWDKFKTTIFDIPMPQSGCMATERILDESGKTLHPTQKPVTLMENLLIAGGETILDPFMGSGTTGVACARLGRRFIGVEIEKKYFEIACERIDREYAQGKLF